MSKYKNNPNYFLDPVSKRWKKKNSAAEEYAKQVMRDAGIQEKTIDDISPQVSGGGEVPASMVTGNGELHVPEVSIITCEKGLYDTLSLEGKNTFQDRLVIINESHSTKKGDMNKELENVTLGDANIGGSCQMYDVYGDGGAMLRDSILTSSNVRNGGSVTMYNSEADLIDVSGSDNGNGNVEFRGNTVASDVLVSYGDNSYVTFHGDNRFNSNQRGAVGEQHHVSNSSVKVGDDSHVNIRNSKSIDNLEISLGDGSQLMTREMSSNGGKVDIGSNSILTIDDMTINCPVKIPDNTVAAIYDDGNYSGHPIVSFGYETYWNGDGMMELKDSHGNKYSLPLKNSDMKETSYNMD